MNKLILITAIAFSSTIAFTQNNAKMNMEQVEQESIVRISMGYFQPDQTEKVESMLNKEFKTSLIPAIRKLKGNLGYNVAIDKEAYDDEFEFLAIKRRRYVNGYAKRNARHAHNL
jgi:hypothetical protein